MSLHPGMKFKYIKGKAKGRIGRIINVAGNDILVETSKSRFWCNIEELKNKVMFRW